MNEYTFQQCKIGLTESFSTKITDEQILAFHNLTGDDNPLHSDDQFAVQHGFQHKVVYGMLSASFLSTLAGVYLPGKYSLIHTVDVHFAEAVFVGDILKISGEIVDINETMKLIDVKVRIQNDKGKTVLRGKMRIGFLNE